MTDREPDAQFRDDIATLLQIVEGLDRLEAAMYHARSSIPARQRGYFTPDEDDRLRQMLLAYRNYRISAYEIIDRCREYEAVGSLPSQLRTFILGFAAALTVYSKSQKLIETFRNEPLARRSLNEPEPDFGLEADFFERIFERYTSFQNYATMVAAERFWRRHRRAVRELGIEQEPEIGQLCELIQHRRSAIHRRFHRVVGDRVVHRMQRLRELLLRPADEARYALQAFAFGAVGNLHAPLPPPCFDRKTLDELHPRLRPGDILLMRTERKLTSTLLPGFWIHSAVYLGQPQDFERMGLADRPELRSEQVNIHSGARYGWVVHAMSPKVIIWPLEKCLEVDHMIALRPALADADCANAIRESLRHLGKPYDFEFDFNQSSRLVCTSLIYRSYHGRGPIKFTLVKHLGRYALTCDELCAQALAGLSKPGEANAFHLAALALQGADGRPHLIPDSSALEHLRAIQNGMRPSRDLRG